MCFLLSVSLMLCAYQHTLPMAFLGSFSTKCEVGEVVKVPASSSGVGGIWT